MLNDLKGNHQTKSFKTVQILAYLRLVEPIRQQSALPWDEDSIASPDRYFFWNNRFQLRAPPLLVVQTVNHDIHTRCLKPFCVEASAQDLINFKLVCFVQIWINICIPILGNQLVKKLTLVFSIIFITMLSMYARHF